jgi:hypothetical protein
MKLKNLSTCAATDISFSANNSVANMKKILMIALLGMVSWALAGAPANAAETTSRHSLTLVKHDKKHKKKHHKHKKHKA